MAENIPQVPRYYRLQLVFSDRDRDLKQWMFDNPDRLGTTVREALRERLIAMGELPLGAPGESPSEARPAPGSGQPRRRRAATRAPASVYVPPFPAPKPAPPAASYVETASSSAQPVLQPAPVPAAAPAMAPVAPATSSEPAAAVEGTKLQKDRGRLGRMLGNNQGFD